MRFPFLPANRLLAALVLAMPLPAMAVEEQGQLPLDELRTFADVYNQIRSGYVEEIDDSTLLEYAIQGMLMGLDPHSVYRTPPPESSPASAWKWVWRTATSRSSPRSTALPLQKQACKAAT
jgi:C-terminal processing protease CtpA/Prc